MRTCELWVVGTVFFAGEFYPGHTRMIQAGWKESKPFPPISFNSKPDARYDYYNDGLGGIFSGSGWQGAPSYYLKNCVEDATSLNQPCDCINGGCVPSKTYGTPGKFQNLEMCQSACAKDSNCTGECVSLEEIAALKQAANKLQARLCQ